MISFNETSFTCNKIESLNEISLRITPICYHNALWKIDIDKVFYFTLKWSIEGGCGYTDRYVALCDCDSTRFIHLTISFFSPRLLQGCLDTIIDIGKKHANNQRFPRCEILIYCFVAKPLSSQIFYPRKTFTRKTSIPAKLLLANPLLAKHANNQRFPRCKILKILLYFCFVN